MAPPPHHRPTALGEVRTLWIGGLRYLPDDNKNYLYSCFAHTGKVKSVRIVHNKQSGRPGDYGPCGFIEFTSHKAAKKVLQTYSGTRMPGTEHPFRMSWTHWGSDEIHPDAGPDYSIFVGDLAPDVTDYLLQEKFQAHYASVRRARIVTDPNTGRSKGFGFVKFADEDEKNCAIIEINGVYCSAGPMRIRAAVPKKSAASQLQCGALSWGKLDRVMTKFETFKMLDHESINDMYARLNNIVNELKNLQGEVTDPDIGRKMLGALPKKR